MSRGWLIGGWVAAIAAAAGARIWTALAGPLMWGYDAWGHVAYALFLDLYRGVPWADQGWSYFHPPLHYLFGWVLAQFGSGEVLMRGLPLLASAASLATAALAGILVRRVAPSQPGLALLGFTAVALLPVHLFMSAMPGNELTETLLVAAAVTVFIANESSARPTRMTAAGVGALLGLALLTKFSGLIPWVAATASLALRPFLAGPWRESAGRAFARAAVMGIVALAIASPYYVRNLVAFGSPFQLSRDFPLVTQVEIDQPPGSRGWIDYLTISPRLFTDPNPLAPHMLHSVWGTVYLNVWADSYRESDVARALEAEREERRSSSVMALLGLGPAALALAGALLAVRDVIRGRRRAAYVPLLLLSVLVIGAFAVFAWRVPIWSALKASYLFGLSLPYAVFIARAAEFLGCRRSWWQRVAAPAVVGVAGLVATVVAAPGVVLPIRAHAPATGAVHFYFGEYPEARRIYGRLANGSAYPVPWIENLAAVDLADGNPNRARRLYARAVALARSTGRSDPQRAGRLAVATALDGDLETARRLLDTAAGEHPLPELLANRGAIRAALGDLAGAEADLNAGLMLSSAMVPAWRTLAVVREARGEGAKAARARERAAREACRVPRGYPYGVGTGEVLEWGVGRRWLLRFEEGVLRPALPVYYRRACGRLGSEAG